MADIVQVILVVIYGTQNMGNGPVHNFFIEVRHLARDIVRQILGILEIHGSHNYSEFIHGLIVDHVFFRTGLIVYGSTDPILDNYCVFLTKESIR